MDLLSIDHKCSSRSDFPNQLQCWATRLMHRIKTLDRGTPSLIAGTVQRKVSHPGVNPGANLKSIFLKCYFFEVAFVWELTKEIIVLGVSTGW